MNKNIARSWYSFPVLLAASFFLCLGCGDQQNMDSITESTSGPVAEHASHEQGPGEHQQGAQPAAAAAGMSLDWCAEHRVPESECTQCSPLLADAFKASGDWCLGHGLPESHCRLCNPGIVFPQDPTLRSAERDLRKDEIEVSLFFRPNADGCATDGALIQLASAETARRAGIAVTPVVAVQQESVIEAPAEVVFDETTEMVITTTVAALVSRWLIAPGEVVEAGSPLALLQSPEIARLQADLIAAQADLRVHEQELARSEELLTQQLIGAADYERQLALAEQARAQAKSAKGLLMSAGMTGSDVEGLLRGGNIGNHFTLRSPSAGLIVERIAQLGQLLDAGSAFATLADPTSMWIEAQLTEEQLRYVSLGQPLTFTSDGRGLNRVGAKVIWVSRFLDRHTRTGTVRAVVLDRGHNLQAGELGRVSIVLQEASETLLVPKGAVQWEGCCNVVFVRESIDRYRPRKVIVCPGRGPYYQVTEGLRPGEEVVVGGSFLLKTELKKTSLGAGCCGLEPAG